MKTTEFLFLLILACLLANFIGLAQKIDRLEQAIQHINTNTKP